MDPTVPTTEGLLTFAGLTIFVTAITEVVIRAWQPDPQVKDRFGPLLALGVALVAAGGAALYLHSDLFQAIILAVLVGWGAMGVHDTATTVTGG